MNKIKNAYSANPILFIHIAAVVIMMVYTIANGVFLSVAGRDSTTEWLSAIHMLTYFGGIGAWLASASGKRCQAHKADESKITYIALWLYSKVLWIMAILNIFSAVVILVEFGLLGGEWV